MCTDHGLVHRHAAVDASYPARYCASRRRIDVLCADANAFEASCRICPRFVSLEWRVWVLWSKTLVTVFRLGDAEGLGRTREKELIQACRTFEVTCVVSHSSTQGRLV